MGKCCVTNCGVSPSTSIKSPRFKHVHPSARGKMFAITKERRKAWKNLLSLEGVASPRQQLICCRHFSLAQYNEIRLTKGFTFNVLQPWAKPDLCLPGQTNPTDLPDYDEIEQENHFQEYDPLSGSEAPINTCLEPEMILVKVEQHDYLMDSSETTSQKSQLQTPMEAGGQCSTNTNIQIREQEKHFQDYEQLSGSEAPINTCLEPEMIVVKVEPHDYLMDSSETTSQKSQLQTPMEAGGQCSTNTNIQISKNKEVATKNVSGDQNLIILQIATQKTKTYDALCRKIYKNIPKYAEKTEYFYARNVSELVSRQFLKDVYSAMRKQDKEINGLKSKNRVLEKKNKELEKKNKELEKSKASIKKQMEWFERAAEEKAKLLGTCVTCAQELS